LSLWLVPDELWALAEPLIRCSSRVRRGGTAPLDAHAVFTAIVYVLTMGVRGGICRRRSGVLPTSVDTGLTVSGRCCGRVNGPELDGGELPGPRRRRLRRYLVSIQDTITSLSPSNLRAWASKRNSIPQYFPSQNSERQLSPTDLTESCEPPSPTSF
jgi:hypothetical protein